MERISCVMELDRDDFHYNVYDELKERYTDRVYNEPQYKDKFNEINDFINEYLEFVKDDSNENFKKYIDLSCEWNFKKGCKEINK